MTTSDLPGPHHVAVAGRPPWRRAAALGAVLLLACGSALAQVRGPVTEKGEINGARFHIDIPEGWNGGLVVWLHGYRPPEMDYALPGDENEEPASGGGLIPILGELGYAMAQSAFSAQGFAMREGALEGEALRQHFERSYGAAYPAIVAGAHLGGLITYDVIERFPESFDGALAIGGSGMPKLEFVKQRLFDMRLLFDYYYPGGLPGSVVEFPAGVGILEYRQIARRLLAEHPERAAPLLDMFQLDDANELAVCVSLYSSILQDLYVNRAGGNAFDNTNTAYSGSGDDGKLNREIPRHRAEPEAVAYLRSWNTPTCALSRPLLAVNALHDPVVPIQYTPHYAETCERAGNSELFVQMWMDQASPIPWREGFVASFRALDGWIRHDTRPQPGELAKLLSSDTPSGGAR